MEATIQNVPFPKDTIVIWEGRKGETAKVIEIINRERVRIKYHDVSFGYNVPVKFLSLAY